MPEGHIVHVDARRFTARLAGRTVRAASPQGRFAEGAAALDGRRLTGVEAYGKNLFLRFSVPRGATAGRAMPWLHVHLGLIGGWRWYDADGMQVAGRPLRGAGGGNRRLLLSAGRGQDAVSADLRGAMTCRLADAAGVDVVVDRLGPDPLRDDADPMEGFARASRSKAPLGTLLLRQDVVAGAGLIWRCEAPFLAGIAPQRPGRDVGEPEWRRLWDHLARLMGAAVERGGAEVTTEPADRPAGTRRPTRASAFYLFRRTGEPCRVCGTPISAEPMAGRTVWWCSSCQPD
ncbi:MAG: Fpg/Nei family glycosylase [Nocardioidaceae bacterium]|nr:Fpg/Nei family glycosylase [Nocardioidaceae bacterium]